MPEPGDRNDAAGAAAPVLIGEAAEFTGLLALDGPARVDGQLSGEVIGPGPLWIGPRAKVEARVETDELVVAGALAAGGRRIALREPPGSARLSTPSFSLAEARCWDRCTAVPAPARTASP
jgi:hypothetical protein